VIVVKRGPNLNHTLASLQYEYWGTQVKRELIIVDNWKDGYQKAVSGGERYGLFINSGTVFQNFDQFLSLLDNYPHRGLIGHIVDPLNCEYFWLDDQCFYVDLSLITAESFDTGPSMAPVAVRSKQNIHHDYTPLMLSRGNGSRKISGVQFGEKLIAQVLEKTGTVVNWNQTSRMNKSFLYDLQQLERWKEFNKEYTQLAESQLWVFNNEEWVPAITPTVTCPGSGMFWIFTILQPTVQCLNIVDISISQIKYTKSLWEDWDGNNFGEYVFDFIRNHNIQHLQLGDQRALTTEEQLKLKKRQLFVDRVNYEFKKQLEAHQIENFTEKWQASKHKTVNFYNKNIIDWVDQYGVPEGYTWKSNIDTYKYTLLKSTIEELDGFKRKINKNDH